MEWFKFISIIMGIIGFIISYSVILINYFSLCDDVEKIREILESDNDVIGTIHDEEKV